VRRGRGPIAFPSPSPNHCLLHRKNSSHALSNSDCLLIHEFWHCALRRFDADRPLDEGTDLQDALLEISPPSDKKIFWFVVTPSTNPCRANSSISFKEAVSRKNWTTQGRLCPGFGNRGYENYRIIAVRKRRMRAWDAAKTEGLGANDENRSCVMIARHPQKESQPAEEA
jgi:hypothetical protein